MHLKKGCRSRWERRRGRRNRHSKSKNCALCCRKSEDVVYIIFNYVYAYLFYDYNEKYIKENPRIVDTLAKRNRNIEQTNEQREEDGKPIFSPKVKKLFTGYAPCNTVLIDDAAYNINDKNRQNFIRIAPFGGHTESKENKMSPLTLDKADSELAKIAEILKSLKLDCSDSESLLLPPPPGEAWTTATWTQTAGRRTRKVRRRRLRNARSLRRK